MKRSPTLFLISIPVGIISGYICAFIIALECVAWTQLFAHDKNLDSSLILRYVKTVALVPGAFIGALFLPCAYLLCLWKIPKKKIGKAIAWLFLGVILPSIFLSLGQELAALLGAITSFIVASVLVTIRYQEKANLL
jgi:hypothetical protein